MDRMYFVELCRGTREFHCGELKPWNNCPQSFNSWPCEWKWKKSFGGKNDERISFILDGCFSFGFFNLYGISTRYKSRLQIFFCDCFFPFKLKKNHSLIFIWSLTVKICPFAIYVYCIWNAQSIRYIFCEWNNRTIFVACCRGVSFHIALQSFPIMNSDGSCITLKIVKCFWICIVHSNGAYYKVLSSVRPSIVDACIQHRSKRIGRMAKKK